MAVLCEAHSVLVRRKSIDRNFRGGMQAFLHTVWNSTFCTDGELVRVGFMTPDDVRDYLNVLEENGLRYGKSIDCDIVVVDQLRAAETECDWMECSRIRINESSWVTAAWMRGPADSESAIAQSLSPQELQDRRLEVQAPEGWVFDGSLSDITGYVELEDMPRRMKFLREEDNLDVYLDTDTNTVVYVGRRR